MRKQVFFLLFLLVSGFWILDSVQAQCQSANTLYAFGDSNTVGFGLVNDLDKYVNKIAVATGWDLINKAQNSTQMADQIIQIYGTEIDESTRSVWLAGLNDMRYFGLSQMALASFEKALFAGLAYLAIPDDLKIFGTDVEVAYVGTWQQTPVYGGMGKYSGQVNATATFQRSGHTVCVASISLDSLYGGRFKLTIDGIDQSTYNNYGTATYYSGLAYVPFLVCISNLADTVHTVVFTSLGGGNTYFDWAAGISNTFSNKPQVYIGNVIPLSAAGYVSYNPFNKGNVEAVAAYNSRICNASSTLYLYGLDVFHSDCTSVLNPATDMQADLVHLNIQGHHKIADKFLEIIP